MFFNAKYINDLVYKNDEKIFRLANCPVCHFSGICDNTTKNE
jgi:hypothetical protein